MIGEFMLNIVFSIVEGTFALLPQISWSVDSTSFAAFASIIQMAMYLLPMDTIGQIVAIIILFTVFKVIVSLVKTIWDVLPIL